MSEALDQVRLANHERALLRDIKDLRADRVMPLMSQLSPTERALLGNLAALMVMHEDQAVRLRKVEAELSLMLD